MLIRCRGAAGKILLLEDAQQSRSMQRVRVAVIVALRTGLLEDGVAVHLLRVQPTEGCGRRR